MSPPCQLYDIIIIISFFGFFFFTKCFGRFRLYAVITRGSSGEDHQMENDFEREYSKEKIVGRRKTYRYKTNEGKINGFFLPGIITSA